MSFPLSFTSTNLTALILFNLLEKMAQFPPWTDWTLSGSYLHNYPRLCSLSLDGWSKTNS